MMPSHHVFGTEMETKLKQFTMDTVKTPTWVLASQSHDPRLKFWINRRPPTEFTPFEDPFPKRIWLEKQ
jgi:hypothetical protein